jgi:hypothetical protein
VNGVVAMQHGRATGCLVVGSLIVAANKTKAKNRSQKSMFLLQVSQT